MSDIIAKNDLKNIDNYEFDAYEDAGLFDRKDCHIFGNYIKNKETKYLRKALIDLFEVLNQKEESGGCGQNPGHLC